MVKTPKSPPVWFVTSGRYPGWRGTPLAIRWLAEAWIEQGHQAEVWTADSEAGETPLNAPSVPTNRTGQNSIPDAPGPSVSRFLGMVKLSRGLRRAWAAGDVKPILHAHHVDGAWACRAAAGDSNRVVAHLHTRLRDELGSYGLPSGIAPHLGSVLDRAILGSARARVAYHAQPGIRRIEPAVPRYEVKRLVDARKEPASEPLVIYLGNADRYQNLDTVLRWVPSWPAGVRLRWVAHEAPSDVLWAKLRALGERVEYAHVADSDEALSVAAPGWWGICPRTLSAGFPFKALTYQGLGLPTIASQHWSSAVNTIESNDWSSVFFSAVEPPLRVSAASLDRARESSLLILKSLYLRLSAFL